MRSLRGALAVVAAASIVAAGAATVWGQAATEWKAPADAKNLKNPEKAADAGKKSVETNCASCHGPQGKGDGPAAAALNPRPANWQSDKLKKETDGELFWKVTNGRGPMPPWKHLPEKERWQIVNYIRQLQGVKK
ncbi:MAG: cytochrome c [Candidatus Rokubacteria bacterium]|nr:cytochrome c [Candidatus Rokubacteria bacterium]